MLGAVVGDVVGSRFEFANCRSKDFALFAPDSRFTDDTVATLAVARALQETAEALGAPAGAGVLGDADGDAPRASDVPGAPAPLDLLRANTVRSLRDLGRRYPDCGFGGMFARWLQSDDPRPYGSFGNGAAMRVSPVGLVSRTEDEALALARAVTDVTHDHPEGVKGAQATALAVHLARRGCPKDELRRRIESAFYPLDFRVDDLRESFAFDVTCPGTVPQAIACFLEADSFEDAVRTAVSLGGDSDTLAAIAGGIAGAWYGVPPALERQALAVLDDDLRALSDRWDAFARDRAPARSGRACGHSVASR